MKTRSLAFLLAMAGMVSSAWADGPHFWTIPSPDHEQTFAYGMEKDRVWTERGRSHHLALQLSFTNDPFVDRSNPRQYDNFTFSFPSVVLGKDGRTYSYRAKEGRMIPVATRSVDFLGVTEVKLLPNARLIVNNPHGYLSLSLVVEDPVKTTSK